MNPKFILRERHILDGRVVVKRVFYADHSSLSRILMRILKNPYILGQRFVEMRPSQPLPLP